MTAVLQWWRGLRASEQQILRVAAVVLALGLFMTLVWQPLHQQLASSQAQAKAASAQLQWLSQQMPLLASSQVATGGSLNDKIAQTSRLFGINVSRMQPKNDQLDLMLEDVPFEQLLRWLQTLQQEQGVALVMLEITEAEQAGVVRVRRLVVE